MSAPDSNIGIIEAKAAVRNAAKEVMDFLTYYFEMGEEKGGYTNVTHIPHTAGLNPDDQKFVVSVHCNEGFTNEQAYYKASNLAIADSIPTESIKYHNKHEGARHIFKFTVQGEPVMLAARLKEGHPKTFSSSKTAYNIIDEDTKRPVLKRRNPDGHAI